MLCLSCCDLIEEHERHVIVLNQPRHIGCYTDDIVSQFASQASNNGVALFDLDPNLFSGIEIIFARDKDILRPFVARYIFAKVYHFPAGWEILYCFQSLHWLSYFNSVSNVREQFELLPSQFFWDVSIEIETWIQSFVEWTKTVPRIQALYDEIIQKLFLEELKDEIRCALQEYFDDELYWDAPLKNPFDHFEVEQFNGPENTIICSICYETIKSNELIRILPCGHLFHSLELLEWGEHNSTCPNCRLECK